MEQGVTASKRMIKFVEDRKEWNEKEIELGKMYYLYLLQEANEKNRGNTARITNILAFYFVISLIAFLWIIFKGAI